jgi:hypothetical protein
VNVRTAGEDLIMASHLPVTDRILGTVERTQGCDFDTLTNSLSDLSWSQVFLEVDRLSREGKVLVTFDTGGRYMIRLPAQMMKRSAIHHVRPRSTKALSTEDQRG